METQTQTISKEVQLAWDEMSAKWKKETTWPTLEESRQAYMWAIHDHEKELFLIPYLEIQIKNLENHLGCLCNGLSETKSNIELQIAEKQAEIVSCEERLVLIEQRMQRHQEIYQHLMIVNNRRIQKERFPKREWPRRQSKCLWPPKNKN